MILGSWSDRTIRYALWWDRSQMEAAGQLGKPRPGTLYRRGPYPSIACTPPAGPIPRPCKCTVQQVQIMPFHPSERAFFKRETSPKGVASDAVLLDDTCISITSLPHQTGRRAHQNMEMVGPVGVMIQVLGHDAVSRWSRGMTSPQVPGLATLLSPKVPEYRSRASARSRYSGEENPGTMAIYNKPALRPLA